MNEDNSVNVADSSRMDAQQKANSNKTDKYKRVAVLGLGLVAAFVIGHQSSNNSASRQTLPQNNNSNKTQVEPQINNADNTPEILSAQNLAPAATNINPVGETGAPNCNIKGNISGKNKIYHVPGGSFYARTQAEMCFKTEAEAKAAGFRKSQR